MNYSLGAGWYGEMRGSLPFALSSSYDLETFYLYQIGDSK